jgi:hypothetical protein
LESAIVADAPIGIPTIVLFEMRYGIDGELQVIEFHCDEPWSSKQSSDCNSCSGQLLRQNGEAAPMQAFANEFTRSQESMALEDDSRNRRRRFCR